MATLGIIRMEFFQRHNGDYYIHTGFGRFVESLSPYFERIDVCVPIVPDGFFPFKGSRFQINNVRVIELPNLHGIWSCYKNSFRAMSVISKHIKGWDIVNIRIPEPFFVFAYLLVRYNKKPLFIHVVGDGEKLREAIMHRKKGLIRIFAYFFNKITSVIENRMISRHLTIVNGSSLYNKYKRQSQHLFKIVTSSIWDKEISIKFKKDLKAPYRIIYVGRLSTAKGIFDLLQVIKRLIQLKYRVQLRIVGYPGEAGILAKINQAINELAISKYVTLVGYKKIGTPLWNQYKKSHIFVLPSMSEGTPRVILEAMSQCVPVVTTNVGSIKDVVIHNKNGIMVEVGNKEQIIAGIKSIIENNKLRKRLIINGLKTAKENSLEKSTHNLINILKTNFNYMVTNDE